MSNAGGWKNLDDDQVNALLALSQRQIDAALAGRIGGLLLYGDQLDNPNTADWAVNALAPAAADSNNAALTVRLFDDATEQGVGLIVSVPPTATSVTLRLKSRAETAPGADAGVVPRIYTRSVPNNGPIGAWTGGTDLALVAIPPNENFQYDEQAFVLGTIGLTAGTLTQFELTRNTGAAADDLVGDWALVELQVEFS